MGKPRLIILIRHAQSEGNKNREIHQSIPDHRVRLTSEGQKQALEAGRKLRSLLRPDDTLQFYTSPYRRTRETTEGILQSLTSDDPSPSPFPRHAIKVYEEPRLREQDFGNFQPCSAEMERMWQERADYGHFFYRISNGESAADAYDRISGFNESLWRQFGEDEFPSVCILVTHGLMTRVFLMKWYHFSVEYFEDLRNINHCEFVVMKRNNDNGKYILQNQLRTWSELRRERAARGSISQPATRPGDSPVPIRRKWGGCPDGCDHAQHRLPRRPPVRKNTADMFKDDDAAPRESMPARNRHQAPESKADAAPQEDLCQDSDDNPNEPPAPKSERRRKPQHLEIQPVAMDEVDSSPNATPFYIAVDPMAGKMRDSVVSPQGLRLHRLAGRDGGGSKSGAGSQVNSSDDENEATMDRTVLLPHKPRSLAQALNGEFRDGLGPNSERVLADALGDQSDASVDAEDEEETAEARRRDEENIRRAERRDKSLKGSVY